MIRDCNTHPPDLPEPAAGWRARGAMETLADTRCFVIDSDLEDGGLDGRRNNRRDAVVWLHGFPSSSLDWRAVVDALAPGRRMLLLDFAGFGFSEKPDDNRYSLIDQADRVVAMLQSRGIERVIIIAHDMGTSVACELLTRRERGGLPFEIAGVVWTNGSVYIEQARLTPSQKLLRSPLARPYTRLASARLFRWQLRRIVHQPIARAELDAMWRLMQLNDGIARLPRSIGYIGERYWHGPRWTEPLTRLDLPCRVIWGARDPVAVRSIGQRLADTLPLCDLVWLDDVGHFPMLEAPVALARHIEEFLIQTVDEAQHKT